jgi:hypothetical protein
LIGGVKDGRFDPGRLSGFIQAFADKEQVVHVAVKGHDLSRQDVHFVIKYVNQIQASPPGKGRVLKGHARRIL